MSDDFVADQLCFLLGHADVDGDVAAAAQARSFTVGISRLASFAISAALSSRMGWPLVGLRYPLMPHSSSSWRSDDRGEGIEQARLRRRTAHIGFGRLCVIAQRDIRLTLSCPSPTHRLTPGAVTTASTSFAGAARVLGSFSVKPVALGNASPSPR